MPRQYTSPLRQERAKQTRLAIIEAALQLFLERGYGQTSIRQIAESAGVAERTVYTAFPDKPALLMGMASQLYYGTPELAAAEADFMEQVAMEPRVAERLRMVITKSTDGLEQGAAALYRIVSSAAIGDPRLQGFMAEMIELRHEDIRKYTTVILGQAPSEDALPEPLIDKIEAITSDDVYLILSQERGWSRNEYETFMVQCCLSIFADHGLKVD